MSPLNTRKERVQKILAQAGIASRRKAEELIELGAVTINGRVAKLGDQAELGKDAIKVNGKLVLKTESPIYVLFHKPRGVIAMMEDPEGRPTLKHFLKNVTQRIFPVGRLAFNADGLIFLTNDGQFAERLQRSDDVARIYHVKLKGHLDQEMLDRIAKGARQGRSFVKPLQVKIVENLNKKTLIQIVMLGVSTIDMKLWLESRGFLVEKISRVGIGQLTLRGVQPGKYKILKKSQIDALLEHPELGLRVVERQKTVEPKAPPPPPKTSPRTAFGSAKTVVIRPVSKRAKPKKFEKRARH